MIKINFDASMNDLHVAGFGFIARDSNSELLAATTASPFDILSPVLARGFLFEIANVFSYKFEFLESEF